MYTDRIRIIFNKNLFSSAYERASVSTVFDAYMCMGGFFADEIQLEMENGCLNENNDGWAVYIYGGKDREPYEIPFKCIKEYYKTTIPIKTIEEAAPSSSYFEENKDFENDSVDINLMRTRDRYYEYYVACITKPIFEGIIKVRPEYKSVTDLFYDNSLWQIAVLSQTCSDNPDVRKYVFDMSDKCYNGADKIKSSESHFLYTKLYLKYLYLSMKYDETISYFRNGSRANEDLKKLFNNVMELYQRTSQVKFIKLSAMILWGMRNLEYAEKMYLRYIQLISADQSLNREIGKIYYEIGHMFENFSNRDSYTLNTIFKASGYYEKAYDADHENYRAWYKIAIPPHIKRTSSNNIKELLELQKKLALLKNDIEGTFRVYLYHYRTTNRLLLYSIRNRYGDNDNQSYIDDLRNDIKEISAIWSLLCPGGIGIKGKKELDRFFQTQIQDVAELYLTLNRNGISQEFLEKRKELEQKKKNSNISLTTRSKSVFGPVGALS